MHISAMSCACRSVGKPGKGSVSTADRAEGRRRSAPRGGRTVVSSISTPLERKRSSALSRRSARVFCRITSPPVMAAAMA